MSSRIKVVGAMAVVALLFSIGVATAGAEGGDSSFGTEPEGSPEVIDHQPFGELLERYVDDDGQVDYRQWARSESDRQKLSAYLDEIADADGRGHSRRAVLAFLINAYNALVIADVLERWPVDNVLQQEGFFDDRRHRILQTSMTLDRLDKQVIRQRYQEPRVNFVLVCAAASCPPLRSTPMTADNLERSLQEATTNYIPQVTELAGDGQVRTSKLFEWYGEEFEESAGSVASYLAQYTDGPVQEALNSEAVEIVFSDYDWSINQSP